MNLNKSTSLEKQKSSKFTNFDDNFDKEAKLLLAHQEWNDRQAYTKKLLRTKVLLEISKVEALLSEFKNSI